MNKKNEYNFNIIGTNIIIEKTNRQKVQCTLITNQKEE